MRSSYRNRLAEIEQQGLDGIDLAVEALDGVLQALALHDVAKARTVVADDDALDGRCLETHGGILSLLALQAPVAGDLRTMIALIDVVSRIERIGEQCVMIARLVTPDEVDAPNDGLVVDSIARMGRLAHEQLLMAKHAFATRDVALAEQLVQHDREINALNRAVFRRGLEIGGAADVREWAMRMTLTARCLERIGDNAVDIGERAAFIATGRLREFSDASHP
jgi:phosphate transport system protein